LIDLVAAAEMVNHGSGQETDFIASLHADGHEDLYGSSHILLEIN
jgi:hypothetical protein